MITATAQTKNAIKWIDSLKGGKKGFKKGTGSLGVFDDGDDEDENGNPRTPDRFCCLGVGTYVCKITPDNWYDPFNSEFAERVGLYNEEGEFHKVGKYNDEGIKLMGKDNIANVNDEVYENDETFTNMRKFIIKHIDNIFIPKVAEKLKQHYRG